MLLIPCPHCGPRDETEFKYGGQAGVAYPADPDALTDAEWVEYLFLRDNPKGVVARALGPHGRLPALVRAGAGHADQRDPGRDQRAAARPAGPASTGRGRCTSRSTAWP